MEYIINEKMDRESQMYDQGMMPYDMTYGYGRGIMPDPDTPYEPQLQMTIQGYIPYGTHYVSNQGIMAYVLYYMPGQYNMYYHPWMPYYPVYSPLCYCAYHYHRDEY